MSFNQSFSIYMLPLSRIIIRYALPRTMPLLYRSTVSAGLAGAIHHQTLYNLALTLFRTLKHGLPFLNISFIHDLLPKGLKIDLKTLRRVLVSAVIGKIFKYILATTFWIPFRGTIIELLLNEAAGNYATVKTIVRALNHVTLPWLQEMNSILQWVVTHVQPVSDWHISIAWIPVIIGLTSLATYFYWFPYSDFSTDLWSLYNAIGSGLLRFKDILSICTFGASDGLYNLLSYPVVGAWYIIKKTGSVFKDLGIVFWDEFKFRVLRQTPGIAEEVWDHGDFDGAALHGHGPDSPVLPGSPHSVGGAHGAVELPHSSGTVTPDMFLPTPEHLAADVLANAAAGNQGLTIGVLNAMQQAAQETAQAVEQGDIPTPFQ